MREALTADPRVQMAARFAVTFKVDPLEVLRSTRREWLIRMGALHVIVQDRTPTTT